MIVAYYGYLILVIPNYFDSGVPPLYLLLSFLRLSIALWQQLCQLGLVLMYWLVTVEHARIMRA